MKETKNLPTVGARVILNGYKGTVKYVGEVKGAQGVWLGIEWDDPSRGRHDGARDGVKYFACT